LFLSIPVKAAALKDSAIKSDLIVGCFLFSVSDLTSRFNQAIEYSSYQFLARLALRFAARRF